MTLGISVRWALGGRKINLENCMSVFMKSPKAPFVEFVIGSESARIHPKPGAANRGAQSRSGSTPGTPRGRRDPGGNLLKREADVEDKEARCKQNARLLRRYAGRDLLGVQPGPATHVRVRDPHGIGSLKISNATWNKLRDRVCEDIEFFEKAWSVAS
jgi:hypothetical protein